MARTIPEEAFAEARAAMERGDWDGFFACIDPDNVRVVAENGLGRFLMGDETTAARFSTLCREHGVPEAAVSELRGKLQQISDSARAVPAHPAGRLEAGLREHPAAMREHSLRHVEIVKGYRN